jgi:DNA-binding transcriptional LysR family regulator
MNEMENTVGDTALELPTGSGRKDRVNLRQIQAFRAVIVTGTTLEAGTLLHISQPAVSRLISDLEVAAGYQLFERKQGRLRPTQQALALLDEVEKVFSSIDRVANLLCSARGSNAGHVRVIATTPMAHGLLPHALAAFRKKNPNVSVSLEVVVRRELRPHIDAQLFDVALSCYPLDYPDSASEMLQSVDAVCIVPIGHRFTGYESITAADLVDEHVVAMPLETAARQKMDAAFQNIAQRPKMVSEAQYGAVICQLVAAGMGVAVVDRFSALAFAHMLVQIPFRPTITHQFRFFFPLQRPRLPLAMSLAAICREVAEEMFKES